MKEDFYFNVNHHQQQQEQNGQDEQNANADIQQVADQGEEEDWNFDRITAILREGNDIQRISILRNLPSLLDNNRLSWRKRGENEEENMAKNTNGYRTLEIKTIDQNGNSENEKLYKILPAVQETLKSGTACLEVHLEASHAYKDLIEQSVSRDDDLSKHILRNIIENLDSPDSIASAAWLEALLDVVIHLPASLIHSFILPLTSQKSQQFSNVVARLTAAKLLGNVAYKLSPLEVKMHVVPLVQSLCQDNDAGVRASVCRQIAIIAHSLSLPDLKSIILPIVIEFSKDSDDVVREATLEAIVALFDAVDCDISDTRASVLLPLAERFVSEIIEKANPKTLVVLSKCYVALYKSMKKCLSIQQQKWFLEKFIYLCEVGTDQELSDDENGKDYKLDFFPKKNNPQAALQNCRENAALSFPIIAEITGLENFKNVLLASYKKLCQDAETEVKRNVASGFHNIVQMLGSDAHQLLDSFIDLVYSGEPEVIAALTSNLSLILEHLYQVDQRKSAASDYSDDLSLPYSHTQLTRILLACNRLIRNCSNWRCHEQYLLALSCIYKCVSQQILMASFWPMLKEEVFNTRALPCRIAALTTIVAWMKNISDNEDTMKMANFFSAVVVQHKSCHKRMLYLDACQLIINRLPSKIFKIHFLDAALTMADDPVANIRVRLCRMLPIFWQTLSMEVDSLEIKKKLNSALEKILSKESFASSRSYFNEIMRKITNELSSFNSTNVDKKLIEKSAKTSNNNAKTSCPTTFSMPSVFKGKSTEIINGNSNSTITPKISTDEIAATETTKLIPVDANAKQRQPMITCSISINTHPIEISSTDEQKKVSIVGAKNDEKVGIYQNIDVEGVNENGFKLMKQQRSPSPPAQKRSLSSVTSAGLPPVVSYSNKKTAIIRPRQLLNRSPSPHPAVVTTKDEEKNDSKMNENSSSKEKIYNNINYNRNTTCNHHSATSIPHQTSKTLPRKFSPSLMSISPNNNSSGSDTVSDIPKLRDAEQRSFFCRTWASNSERIVPIKLTHSSSSSSVNVRPSSSKPPASNSSTNISNSRWSHHAVGPLSSRNDHHNQRMSSSTASGVLERKSSFPSVAAGQTTRSIPIVQTGNVLKSVEKFESSPSTSSRDSQSSFISRRSSYAPPSAGGGSSSIYNLNANKPPTRTSSGSLGYSKLMNRSFSSFPSSNSSGSTGYYDQHQKGRNSSLMTQSVDRPSFSLTRVRSGSSIQVPALSSTHSSRFMSRNL